MRFASQSDKEGVKLFAFPPDNLIKLYDISNADQVKKYKEKFGHLMPITIPNRSETSLFEVSNDSGLESSLVPKISRSRKKQKNVAHSQSSFGAIKLVSSRCRTDSPAAS